MLLAVDIGNSSTKFGIFDGDELVSKFDIPTERDASASRISEAVAGRINTALSGAIAVSVVPSLEQPLRSYLQLEHNIDPVFVRNTFDFGMTVRYEPITAAGTDRLVAAAAAFRKYGAPVVVCDFGTATTIDAVNSAGEYLGGIITPGMTTMAESLHLKTSKLPLVRVSRPAMVIGNSTISSIESGIFWGYVGLAGNLISMISAELNESPKVIATGGHAELIAAEVDLIDLVDPDLVLTGLADLHARTKAKG